MLSYHVELLGLHRTFYDEFQSSEVLEMIYGGNTVTHVLNENSFPRASCGYILVELMLSRLLIQKTYLQATSKRPPSDDDTLYPGLYVALFDRMMDNVWDNTVICEIAQGVETTQERNGSFRHL